MDLRPQTISELQDAVQQSPKLIACAGGTKPALSAQVEGAFRLDLSALEGILEYEPGEFTITALAGTPIANIGPVLEAHGQYLPFDPPLVERGATLGGSVAAGLSGAGRYRYGGLRDFFLGVSFVNGGGRLIRGGGKVVKNSAGFDLPKLMVGSLGSLGVMVELTFKVFPRPEAFASVRFDCEDLGTGLEAIYRLYLSQLDIDSLDFEPLEQGAMLWVRLAGLELAMPARLERLKVILGGGSVVVGPEEDETWRKAREFEWVPQGWSLIKVPLTPKHIAEFERCLNTLETLRRYSGGGQVAWVASPLPAQAFDALLKSQSLAGLALLGPPGQPRLGVRVGDILFKRVKEALDPERKWLER